MPKLPRLTAKEAENLLIHSGFVHIRSKGSHRIYQKGKIKIVVPFHSRAILHPKIVKQILNVAEK